MYNIYLYTVTVQDGILQINTTYYVLQEVFVYAGRFRCMQGLCSRKSQANRNCTQ